jgi:hypothetical protein
LHIHAGAAGVKNPRLFQLRLLGVSQGRLSVTATDLEVELVAATETLESVI